MRKFIFEDGTEISYIKIPEIKGSMMFEKRLTKSQIDEVNKYLADKYKITLSDKPKDSA